MRRVAVRLSALVVVLACAATAEGSVLCARPRRDGGLNGNVKIRQVCRPSEVTLTPDMVGFCCTATTATTTTTTTVTSTMPCPTSTTLGALPCGLVPGGASCLGVCIGGQTCSDIGGGQCGCTGPLLCGVGGACGGSCSGTEMCLPTPVPPGCPPTGSCECQ